MKEGIFIYWNEILTWYAEVLTLDFEILITTMELTTVFLRLLQLSLSTRNTLTDWSAENIRMEWKT